MATISEHIEQLKIDKQTLVDNLVEKGVEATNDETFTTLVPKVKEIQSGADLSEYFADTIEGGSADSGWKSALIKYPPMYASGTSFASMYDGCPAKEIDISLLDWTNIIYAQSMFYNTNLENVNLEINAPKLTNIQSFFQNNKKITNVDFTKFNAPNVVDIGQLCMGCTELVSFNMSNWNLNKINRIVNIFYNCTKLTNLEFGKNLGSAYATNITENYSNYKLDLSKCTLLTETSLISVLNGLYDIKTKGCNPQQCILGETNLAKLTSEAGQQALAQAQAYGWTVS